MDIRYPPKWSILLLTLNALSVAGQEREQSQQPAGVTVNDYGADRMDRITQETLEEKAHSAETGSRGRVPAEIVPSGWLDDYDYQSDLTSYLSGKYQDALNSSNNTYVYLYADWYENCRVFRKSAGRKDYAKLFLSKNIIMLDYNFFKKKFNIQTRNLPMILKVNKGGILGPESIDLVSNLNDHPKKSYYKLKGFFSSNEETP